MNVAVVIKGDPNTLKAAIEALIVANTILVVKKTGFAGSFIVVYDDTASTAQTVEIIRGTPDDVAAALSVIGAAGGDINCLEHTCAAGFYLVVYT